MTLSRVRDNWGYVVRYEYDVGYVKSVIVQGMCVCICVCYGKFDKYPSLNKKSMPKYPQ